MLSYRFKRSFSVQKFCFHSQASPIPTSLLQRWVWFGLLGVLATTCLSEVFAQDRTKLPREDVVEVPARGEGLCVSNVFQSNMVLQRDKPIHVWGWSAAGDEVNVQFGSHAASATAEPNGRWEVELPACPTNTKSQTLVVSNADSKLTLEDILVGDVWVLGGQSNMEFPLDRVENGELEIVSARFANIRILTVPAQNGSEYREGFPRLHEWSSWFGRHFRKGDWDVCSPQIARELSAIGYVFARRIHMATEVPIGIIDVSRGGTTVETWTPENVLREIDSRPVKALLEDWNARVSAWDANADLENRQANYRRKVERLKKEGKTIPPSEKEPEDLRPGPAMDQNRPGNCFASMIAPLAGLQVKGAIFHQGYNNCFNGTEGAILYRQVFPRMIQAWRAAFQDPALPFGILSLCTEGPVQTLDNYSEMMANAGPHIREAQYQTFLDLQRAGDQNIGFVSTYDLRRRWYHPQLKLPAGERAARWALATEYDLERQLPWQPPQVLSTNVVGNSIEIRFDVPVGAVDDGSPIVGFALAGDDRRFHPAQADYLEVGKDDRGRPKLDRKTLVLRSEMVTQPIHFRYAWGRSPLGNLQRDRVSDVPVATQRSDDWPMEAVPAGVFDETPGEKLNRGQRQKLLQALRELDRQRRLESAKKLLRDAGQ